VGEKRVKILIRSPAVFTTESLDAARIGAVNRRDFGSPNGADRTSVCGRDVSAADETDMDRHVGFEVYRTLVAAVLRRQSSG
jgi:hypothetical protein